MRIDGEERVRVYYQPVRLLLHTSLVCGVLLSFALAWLVFGVGGDLKDMLPQVPTAIQADSCHGSIHALPASKLRVLMPALSAAETNLPMQLSRGLTCESGIAKNLSRELHELRVAAQLRVRYSSEERSVAYLNDVYFGEEQYGAGDAAEHYFGLLPAQLTTSQAAELVALIRGPTLYSPSKHSECALARRNLILTRELEQKSITKEQQEEATAAPLGH